MVELNLSNVYWGENNIGKETYEKNYPENGIKKNSVNILT